MTSYLIYAHLNMRVKAPINLEILGFHVERTDGWMMTDLFHKKWNSSNNAFKSFSKNRIKRFSCVCMKDSQTHDKRSHIFHLL